MRKPLTSFRSLRSETLEDRRLLATDLGQIAGVVTNDLTGDGAMTAPASGVGVQLFLDDGDGIFDPVSGGGGDAQQGATIMTAADGSYSFDSLTAGNYFVFIDPPVGQRAVGTGVSPLIEITATEAMGTTNLTIDDFGTAQTASATSSGATTGDSADGANPDSGGVRDLQVAITAGAGMIDLTSDFVGTGLLNLASTGNVNGVARVVWDGADGDATTLTPNGLSLDLTGGGINSALVLRAAADRMDAELTIRLYDDSANVSEATVTIMDDDAGIDGDASEDISVPFTAFSTGADLTSIGAIEVVIDFSDTTSSLSSLDAQIDVVGVVGFTTETQDFTIENELSLGDLVFLDLDNDGVFEPGDGDLQIGDIALTLFEDTDKDGDFLDEMALDTAIATLGVYSFDGLSPGDYIVRVDESNFLSGGSLFGLATSTGNDVMGMAPDPDDDTNNDDNGTEQPDGSVASMPITLVGDNEPTSDGDGANSNVTLDFGFFGFDLVIDKEVDRAVASPDDTLQYTVTVTNNGPTIATDVELADTLPDGVTFVSGSAGVVGTPGSPSVSADLGTLNPGEDAVVTINATVDSDATGTLTNESAVSATDESNTTNNFATAQTEVMPEIDLAITKSDNDNNQTLSPGDSIQYTLNVSNNGPSTATGVTVVDTLPTGLTFNQTGSTVPASTTPVTGGTQLTYNLGTIAAGAPATTLTINADIDSTFTGSLTNTATVAANENETTTANNSASAGSVVAIEPASISGFVYVDSDDDGVFDAGETPISNVLVTLTGTDFNGAPVTQTAFTNTAGAYSFTGLNPGTYTVTETQPTFFTDGQDSATFPGATATNDQISTITLGPGDNAPANNFGELGPSLTKRRFLASFVTAQIGDD